MENILNNAMEPYLDLLKGLGWHVISTQASEDEQVSFGVHRVRKNGVPLKGADVYLSYWPEGQEKTMDNDGRITIRRYPSPVPFRVESKSMDTAKRFKDVIDAVALFLKEADLLAPKKRG